MPHVQAGGALVYEYEVILYRNSADDLFAAWFPELPDCIAHSNTQEAALTDINDAIHIWDETAREFGDSIPEPGRERPMFA